MTALLRNEKLCPPQLLFLAPIGTQHRFSQGLNCLLLPLLSDITRLLSGIEILNGTVDNRPYLGRYCIYQHRTQIKILYSQLGKPVILRYEKARNLDCREKKKLQHCTPAYHHVQGLWSFHTFLKLTVTLTNENVQWKLLKIPPPKDHIYWFLPRSMHLLRKTKC